MVPPEYYFEEEFKLRLYDTDMSGNVLPHEFFRILQETAGEHHTFVNDNLLKLYARGMSWFLLQAKFEFDRTPQYGERLTVRTWLSQIRSIKAKREYYILDQKGNIIGRAAKLWAFFNLQTKRPIAVPPEIQEKWPVYDEQAVTLDKVSAPGDYFPGQAKITVRKSDLDINRHVNNLRYIQWLEEVLPADLENKPVLCLNAKFMAESSQGDELLIQRTDVSDGKFFYQIENQTTGKTAFSAIVKYKAS